MILTAVFHTAWRLTEQFLNLKSCTASSAVHTETAFTYICYMPSEYYDNTYTPKPELGID